jgi:hypothetical protein
LDAEVTLMRIVDHAGNSIRPGRLLRWQTKGTIDCYVKVKDVVLPTLTAAGVIGQPGRVVVEVIFGIPPLDKQPKENAAVQLSDLVTVFDPEDELRAQAVMDSAAADGKGNTQTMNARG